MNTIEFIQKRLAESLDKGTVGKKPKGGSTIDYVSAVESVIAMNDSFGPLGWDYKVDKLECVNQVNVSNRHWQTWLAIVTVTAKWIAKDGDQVQETSRQDAGVGGSSNAASYEDAAEAAKGAVTDALKRACRWFGPRLGLTLYIKDVNRREEAQGEIQVSYGADPINDPVVLMGESEKHVSNKLPEWFKAVIPPGLATKLDSMHYAEVVNTDELRLIYFGLNAAFGTMTPDLFAAASIQVVKGTTCAKLNIDGLIKHVEKTINGGRAGLDASVQFLADCLNTAMQYKAPGVRTDAIERGSERSLAPAQAQQTQAQPQPQQTFTDFSNLSDANQSIIDTLNGLLDDQPLPDGYEWLQQTLEAVLASRLHDSGVPNHEVLPKTIEYWTASGAGGFSTILGGHLKAFARMIPPKKDVIEVPARN